MTDDSWTLVLAVFLLGVVAGTLVSFGIISQRFARAYLEEQSTLFEACAAVSIGRDDIALDKLRKEIERINSP